MNTTASHFNERPHTKLGWWAVGLAIAGMLLVPAWMILPGGAGLGFLCELAGGIVALIAIIREHERSWLLWLALLPMLNVFVFILGEFLIPH
jgi:nicotinamide riboside transporter PnuC